MTNVDQTNRIEDLKRQLKIAQDGAAALLDFLQSEKFHQDSTVQTGDVIARLNETAMEIADAEVDGFGMSCTLVQPSVINGQRMTHRGSDSCRNLHTRLVAARLDNAPQPTVNREAVDAALAKNVR